MRLRTWQYHATCSLAREVHCCPAARINAHHEPCLGKDVLILTATCTMHMSDQIRGGERDMLSGRPFMRI